jgi:hypothetical protein
VGAALIAAAAVAVAIIVPLTERSHSGVVVDNKYPTSLFTLTRRNLSQQTNVPATLGYSGDFSVINQESGIVTAVPTLGETVTQGTVLYRVSGAPVLLLLGPTPGYRRLSQGMTGDDVAQLNSNLVALGYANRAQIPPSSTTFTYWTAVAVNKLHSAFGEPQTSMLSLGQVVFLPAAIRITAVQSVAGAAIVPGQPVLSGTSTSRCVSIALDASEQSEVAVGDNVVISLPNGRTTPGVISAVGSVAVAPASGGSDTSSTITVLVAPSDPSATGTWDQAPVNVAISTGSAHDVLAVPVDALLSQTGGSYAVEVAGHEGARRLISVRPGLFDDAEGMVQVSGPELSAGMRVVVPKL